MKKLYYLAAIVLFCSCNNNKPAPQVITPTPTGISGLQPTKTSGPVNQLTSNLIYNPAHGQPGHNCAIAVGAPLNQRVTAKPGLTPSQTSTPSPAVTIPAVTGNNKSQKLNPKHGDPGHRCDLAVGVPLNSKPAETPKVRVSPAKIDNSLETKNSIKINPKHGETGHRCDIAVGAPLT
ncbi:hypothetical protein [Pedobacter nototheniae]|uniref:hypothetical protein n=1 Tax=Pedobacter nototheniae TaxID=2488994 RepID=UPI00292E0458|nr:hypothetical protein [Pedobacter nototheniae]